MGVASGFLAVEGGLDDFADAAYRADHLAGLQRHQDHLAVIGRGQLAQGVDVFLRDKVVHRLHVTFGDGLGDHLGRPGFGFGLALTGLGLQEGRLPGALGFEYLRLLLAFGGEDRRGAQAFGFEDLRALDPFGLHLPGHGRHQVGGWADVLDLDAGHLDPPRRGRFVDGAQQALIDGVALAEHGVQFHGAEHGADIGLQQVADGVLEVVHLVGGLGRVDHLEEAHGVDLHRGVVGGDDFLGRDVEHAFHHVDLAPDAVHDRDDDVQAGLEGVGVAPEALHRPLITLGHDLETHEYQGDGQADEEQEYATDLHDNSLLQVFIEKAVTLSVTGLAWIKSVYSAMDACRDTFISAARSGG